MITGYAVRGAETFRCCKVLILIGINVTGGLPLVLEHPEDLLGHLVGLVRVETDTGGTLGMPDTAGSIVGVLLHVELVVVLHLGVLGPDLLPVVPLLHVQLS